ncbi:MAG: transposase [Mycobacterium sp.]|nr:transposase [Mycobacterium sp.]
MPAREDRRGDLMSARHRLSKLLLREGIVYSGGQIWNGRHESWLRAQRFDDPALQLTCDAMLACPERRSGLDHAITKPAADGEFTPVVTGWGVSAASPP